MLILNDRNEIDPLRRIQVITNQTMNKDSVENGLRERVAACRKRLRVNRTTPRTLIHNRSEEVIPGTTVSVSESQVYPAEYRAMRKYLICNDYRSFEFEGTTLSDTESWLMVGEQEVGIT
jgi:hypothetical protein